MYHLLACLALKRPPDHSDQVVDKQYVRPTTKTPTAEAVPDIQVFADSDWAGCATTRKSTTGFLIKVFGATIHYGSRTQATIALSSAEAELYAINIGATEALHISTQHH